uniref:Uncharacterized protein n=1 Tax=Strombidium inclinatum TaxID=197538 RepID=A0A7S3MTM5_9SPIT|mmetsp:Transcript_12064/g.18622  ORF Transcript_12064/g.18622 Transcript_12064/m.18622 type:complete len:223 (+) Transcript_12064:856-1524(+)
MDMENMRSFISDIEEHCQSKRLKKNIYKFDCIKLGGLQSTSGKGYLPSALAQINYKPSEPIWNPGVTQASSDSVKFPRGQNDPVIDKKFKSENAKIYNEIMKTDFNQQLHAKSMNPEQLFESSNYQDLTEFFDSRKTTTSSSKFGYPYEKEEKQVDPREQVSGRIKKLQDVVFSKANNGKAVEDYKSKVAQDFSKYKQWVIQQQAQRSQKQAQRSQQNTFRP